MKERIFTPEECTWVYPSQVKVSKLIPCLIDSKDAESDIIIKNDRYRYVSVNDFLNAKSVNHLPKKCYLSVTYPHIFHINLIRKIEEFAPDMDLIIGNVYNCSMFRKLRDLGVKYCIVDPDNEIFPNLIDKDLVSSWEMIIPCNFSENPSDLKKFTNYVFDGYRLFLISTKSYESGDWKSAWDNTLLKFKYILASLNYKSV